MQDIYFDKITMTNVRCHEEMELDFPTGQFTAIVGKNGKGKSTVFKALSLALYGDDGEGNRVADMVNKKHGKGLSVIFTFRILEDGREDKYRIELYYKFPKKPDKVFLFKNEVDISGKTKSDTYKRIESAYLPKPVHHNSVYFGQQVKDFFTALTNSDQKEIFNAILMMYEWEERYKKADVVLKSINAEIGPIKDRLLQIDSIIPEKESLLISQQKDNERKVEETKQEIDKLTLVLKECDKKIAAMEADKEAFGFDDNKLKEARLKHSQLGSQQTTINTKISEMAGTLEEKVEVVTNQLISEKTAVLSKGKNEISTFFNRQKTDESSKLKLVMERMTQISNQFSCDSLETERRTFETEKRKEQRYIDSEIYKVDSEFSTAELQTEKDDRLKSLDKKKNVISNESNELKFAAEDVKKEISRLEDSITTDKDSLLEEEGTCSKCGQVLGKEHREKIELEIVDNQQALSELNNDLELKRSKFVEIKSEYDEITRLILSEESSYNEMISEKTKKRNDKKSDLERKKTLIELEISETDESISKKILARRLQEKDELADVESEQEVIENKIGDITAVEVVKLSEIEDSVTKDFDKRKMEQIENIESGLITEQNELQKQYDKLEVDIGENQIEQGKLEDTEKAIQSIDMSIHVEIQTKTMNADRISNLQTVTTDESNIVSTRTEIETLTNEKDTLSEQNSSKLRKIEILSFWKEGFSDRGIKSMLIDSAIPLMNRVCREELEKVSGGKFIVSFDTISETKSGDVKDKFAVHVLNCETGADDHKLLSGGEKRLVDLCSMKAIRALQENQYQKVVHVTLYDEALDALDDDNAAVFCRLMKQMSSDQSVNIITHKIFQNMEADRVFKL